MVAKLISFGEQIRRPRDRISRMFTGKLLHKAKFREKTTVNKNLEKPAKCLNSLAKVQVLLFLGGLILVNKYVDINSLSDGRSVVVCFQFIERTGMTGIRRKKEDASSEDNPRRLGKGCAGLVGATPLERSREAAREAGFTSSSGGVRAPSVNAKQGTERRGANRNRSEPGQVVQAGFGPE